MPVKKKKKNNKEHSKKSKKHSSPAPKKEEKGHEEFSNTQGERDRIKYLVDKIPSLVMQDRNLEKTEPPTQSNKQFDMREAAQEKNLIAEVIHTDKNKYRWLWFGVIIFSTAIFSVWFYNIRSFISDIQFSQSNEQDVFEQSKFDLQNTLKLLSQSEATDKTKISGEEETGKTNFLNNLKESLLSLSLSGNSSSTEIIATNTEDASKVDDKTNTASSTL